MDVETMFTLFQWAFLDGKIAGFLGGWDSAQWVIYYTAGGDRAIFAKNHHPNFSKSFLGVKLHYI